MWQLGTKKKIEETRQKQRNKHQRQQLCVNKILKNNHVNNKEKSFIYYKKKFYLFKTLCDDIL